MLDTKRHWFKGLEVKVGKFFGGLPLTPNEYTILSGVMAAGSCLFIALQDFIPAIIFFLLAGFLDFIDGAVARHKKMSTKIGAYLDTIFDRYVEGFILLGMLFLPLPTIVFPGFVWIFLVLFGSIATTYAKAAAKEKDLVNQELKGGMLSRGERLILIFIALLAGQLYPDYQYLTVIMIVIAVLANITAIQRIFSAIRINKK